MPPSIFQQANGFSNNFWGWGGEDDQMYWILRKMLKLPIAEPNKKTCLFDMLSHQVHGEQLNQPNPHAVREIKNFKNYEKQGLNTLKYEVQKMSSCGLFSHYLVDLFAPQTKNQKNGKIKPSKISSTTPGPAPKIEFKFDISGK